VPLFNTKLKMYSKIQILTTDFESKYLFINDNNLIYGGFMIKDIVELLKQNNSPEKITQILSKKYDTDIDIDVVLDIINVQLQKLFLPSKKKKSIKKIIKINLNINRTYPASILSLFKTIPFYLVFIVTFAINSIYYFNNSTDYTFTYIEQIITYFSLFIILMFHELGHIISAKLHNVSVNEIGFGIYFILPVLYVNLDETWKLNRKKRIVINLSGIYAQSIIGIIILVLFINLETKILWYLFNVNFIIMILNLNPFFQFDGYWVLTDLIKTNNLNQRSTFFFKNILKKSNTPIIIKVYSILKICFIIYLLLFFIKKLITYVS
jgi:putative peptide zinc metalloprotease protein